MDRVEKLGRAWMHEDCREEVLVERMKQYEVIQLPEARGYADEPKWVGSNDRIQRRRRRGGGMS